jgi:hypothetical protein
MMCWWMSIWNRDLTKWGTLTERKTRQKNTADSRMVLCDCGLFHWVHYVRRHCVVHRGSVENGLWREKAWNSTDGDGNH